jgi:hypothetical protein
LFVLYIYYFYLLFCVLLRFLTRDLLRDLLRDFLRDLLRDFLRDFLEPPTSAACFGSGFNLRDFRCGSGSDIVFLVFISCL